MEADAITGRLRLAKPSSLRVFTVERGDDADVIEVSAKRDRWKRCIDVLSTMNWKRIDCLSSKGAIIDTIVQDDASLDDDDDDEEEIVEQAPEQRWLNLMINAQRLALENHAHMLKPLIDGYVSLADTFGARLAALEKHFDRTLDVAYENAVLKAQAEAGPDMDQEVVKALLDKLGKPKKRALKAHAPAKPNGKAEAPAKPNGKAEAAA